MFVIFYIQVKRSGYLIYFINNNSQLLFAGKISLKIPAIAQEEK